MRRTMAIVTVGVRQMLADPVQMMFVLALPVLMTWVMSFLPVETYEMAILGVLVMFVALNIITSAGGYIIDEKQTGTWQRMLASTTSYWHIIAGYFIRLFAVAMAQSMILIFSGKYLFSAPWNYGYWDMAVVLAVYIFAMTGLGLFLAGFMKTQGQVQAVAMGVVMPGIMLGGVFFPIDNASPLIEFIATISPQSWAASALRDILTLGSSLSSLTAPMLWMAAIGTLLLLAGVVRLQMEG